MKRTIALYFIFLVLPIVAISCSASLDADGEKVKTAFIKSRGLRPEFVSFSEIKLVRNVTAEDSINYFLETTDNITKDYNETLQAIVHWTELKKKEANSYSVYNHDSFIQKFTDELNMFADAYDGKFTNEQWKYYFVYSKLYRLRKMDPTKVVGKIYSITYSTKSGAKTEFWLFDAEITTTIGGVLNPEDTKAHEHRNLEKIHFERYKEAQKEENMPEAEVIQEGGDIQE
jgi:hypothetical protein